MKPVSTMGCTLMDDKLHSATQVVQECFWGDYLVTPQEVLERLEKKDPAYGRFLFSKIIENSRYPSKYLKTLFPMEDLLPMLDRYLSMSGGKKKGASCGSQYHRQPQPCPGAAMEKVDFKLLYELQDQVLEIE